MDKVIHRIEHGKGRMEDIDLLVDVAKKPKENTICPLGDAAAWPVAVAIRHFRDEFEWHANTQKKLQSQVRCLCVKALVGHCKILSIFFSINKSLKFDYLRKNLQILKFK